MKRVFAVGIVLTLVLAVLCLPSGALEPVGTDIWVQIENGGTAVIITSVNCPLPTRSRLTLDHGESEAFHIEFAEEGMYSYQIRLEPDGRDITFDDTVYNLEVYVTDVGGRLESNVVIYLASTGMKYAPLTEDRLCGVAFSNSVEPPEPTEPTETQQTKPPAPSNTPKTGDDTRLGLYLLLAFFASAGLFALSCDYYAAVKRDQKRARC